MERLTDLEMECMEVLHLFAIFAPALAGRGYLEVVSEIGPRTLSVGMIERAAELFEANKRRYFAGVKEALERDWGVDG